MWTLKVMTLLHITLHDFVDGFNLLLFFSFLFHSREEEEDEEEEEEETLF